MAIAASILTIAGGATAMLANMPEAVETVMIVMRLIGEDKEREEAERLRLAPPQRALPDYRAVATKPKFGDFPDDLDDDVPF